MPKPEKNVVVSIRVPAGLPNELRALTGLDFSTLVRRSMLQIRNNLQETKAAKGDAND